MVKEIEIIIKWNSREQIAQKDILYDDCTTVEVGTPDRDDGGKFVDIPDPEIREGGYEEGITLLKSTNRQMKVDCSDMTATQNSLIIG